MTALLNDGTKLVLLWLMN